MGTASAPRLRRTIIKTSHKVNVASSAARRCGAAEERRNNSVRPAVLQMTCSTHIGRSFGPGRLSCRGALVLSVWLAEYCRMRGCSAGAGRGVQMPGAYATAAGQEPAGDYFSRSRSRPIQHQLGRRARLQRHHAGLSRRVVQGGPAHGAWWRPSLVAARPRLEPGRQDAGAHGAVRARCLQDRPCLRGRGGDQGQCRRRAACRVLRFEPGRPGRYPRLRLHPRRHGLRHHARDGEGDGLDDEPPAPAHRRASHPAQGEARQGSCESGTAPTWSKPC